MSSYSPREAFISFHNRDKRWACLVCHRRAGKTVACVMELLTRALACKKNRPQYAYVAPLFVQAKQIAWEYLKEFGNDVIAKKNESELYVELINGARIYLLGADNPDRLRGLYLDGVVLDEYADMKSRIFGEVIRPALADRKGWAVFIGTPKGENAFFDVWEVAQSDENWFSMMLKASDSGLLSQEEIDDMKKTMSEDQAAQELECSFQAAIQGAVYAKWVIDAQITQACAYDPEHPVHTAWDLGYDDSTAIWFWQSIGKEVRVIDCYEASNEDISHYINVLKSREYQYGNHYVPHDAGNKVLAAGGRSIVQQAWEQGVKMRIVKATSQQNQIEAARLVLRNTWFAPECKEGLRALRQYQFEYDEEKKTFRSKPKHDWASHYADAFEIIGQVKKEQIIEKVETKPLEPVPILAKDVFALDAPKKYERKLL